MSGVSAWQADEVTSYGPPLLASIGRYRYAVAIATLVFVIVGYLVSSSLTPVYEATATIVLSDAQPFGDEVVDPARRTQQEANRLASRAVFSQAAESLGGISRDELMDRVAVGSDAAVGLLEVTARSRDPESAAETANAVTEAYEQISRQSVTRQLEEVAEVLETQQAELSDQIDTLRSELEDNPSDSAAQVQQETIQGQLVALQTRISEMSTEAALYGSGVADIERAIPPPEPSRPQPLRDAAGAGIVGLALACAAAYWRASYADKGKVDPTAIFGAPLLAQIPDFRPSSGGTAGSPLFDLDAAEAYQFLLSSFEYALDQSGARSILVTSAFAGDGKSLTALHLARALAIQGRDVMLVDSDIRGHGLTTLLNAEGKSGLASLADGEDINNVIRRYRISHTIQLPVIPAGRTPHQPTGLLATAKYRDALAHIISLNELTIIDGGPLLTVADASAVAAQVAGILLVLDARTAEEDLIRVQQRLRLTATPLLGYVLNRASGMKPMPYPSHAVSENGTSRIRKIFGGTPEPATGGDSRSKPLR